MHPFADPPRLAMEWETQMDLKDKRILVVEDDQASGTAICQALRLQGCVAIGPAPTIFYASQLLGRRPVDAAILDTRLYGQDVFELADLLARRGIPILFLAEAGAGTLPEGHRDRPCLAKPCPEQEVVRAVAGLFLAEARNAQAASDHFPRDGQAGRHERLIRTICAVLRRGDGRPLAARSPPLDRTN